MALGGDIYNMMRFTAQGAIEFNGNLDLDYTDAPVETTCAQLIAEAMLTSTEMWDEFILEETSMTAAQLDPLIYCLATSSQLGDTGYTAIEFEEFMIDLNGLLDPNNLALLSAASPSIEEYNLYNLRTLAWENQW